jgi:hypothetical protein
MSSYRTYPYWTLVSQLAFCTLVLLLLAWVGWSVLGANRYIVTILLFAIMGGCINTSASHFVRYYLIPKKSQMALSLKAGGWCTGVFVAGYTYYVESFITPSSPQYNSLPPWDGLFSTIGIGFFLGTIIGFIIRTQQKELDKNSLSDIINKLTVEEQVKQIELELAQIELELENKKLRDRLN